jgi:hypothetical protein
LSPVRPSHVSSRRRKKTARMAVAVCSYPRSPLPAASAPRCYTRPVGTLHLSHGLADGTAVERQAVADCQPQR